MKLIRALSLSALVIAAFITALTVAGRPVEAQTFQSLGSASLSVTTSSGRVALPAGTFGNNVTILNVGATEAFINFGGSTVTAATTHESVPSGSGRCFAANNVTYVAAITAASTTTLRISQGSGPCALSYRSPPVGTAADITVGTTTVTGGTTTRVLYDNAGVLGEYAISGTGSVCMTTSCTMVTPALGTPASGVATNLTGTAAGLTAGTVTTNANLTGPITSTGNATAIAAQTGTGTTFVMQASPVLTTPDLGTPSAGVATNLTGTAAGLTAGNVTTNANLTGPITSVGNATTVVATTTTAALNIFGADAGAGGLKGLVPATAAGDSTKFLRGDATWAAAGGGLTVASTTITSGTTTRVLYNNAGVLGEYTISGSGNVAMTTSPTFVTPVLGAATGTSLAATGAITSSSATAGIGYATGAGGTVTQSGGRTVDVTINKITGRITTTSDSISGTTIATFGVLNSTVAATDTIIISKVSGDPDTHIWVNYVAAGEFKISMRNTAVGVDDSTAMVINFAVIKGVTS